MWFVYALGLLMIPNILKWSYKTMSRIMIHREKMKHLSANNEKDILLLRKDVSDLKSQVEDLTSIVVDEELSLGQELFQERSKEHPVVVSH